jgi:ubiquinone/menaquinone biosynthesis C-methylase UbiE
MAEDRFSKQSHAYALFRPEYPEELYRFLASCVPNTKLVWDCATGTGQAARSLSKHFDRVVATDLSAEQISKAHGPGNVQYKVAQAEDVLFSEGSVDLISVAQAIHWFELESFYSVANKVLREGGILAAWGYSFFKVSHELDAILDPYGRKTLAPFWSERNWLLINEYRDLPFPLQKVEHPSFQLRVNWDLNHLKGYLDSWSATQKFKDQNGSDPFEQIRVRVESVWGVPTQKREVSWDLYLLVGRK